MNFPIHLPSKKTLSLLFAIAAGISVRAQDPVDQQVSPAVKKLEAAGAREDAQSRTEPKVSPEVKGVDAAGAKEDASAWHNLEGFIQEKIKDGLRGKALSGAVKAERQRLGLTALNTAMGKEVREYERAQERIEQIDKKIVAIRSRLADGLVNESSVRSGFQKEIKSLETEKEQLEKRSAKILEDLNGTAKF